MWSKSKNTTNKNNLEIKTVMVMIWMITWTKTQQKSNKPWIKPNKTQHPPNPKQWMAPLLLS